MSKAAAAASSSTSRLQGEANGLLNCIEKVPRDPDGFSPSFDVQDIVGWQPFLQHYGYVVVRILDENECAATVAEFFQEVQRRQKTLMTDRPAKKLVVPDDPSSWEDDNWPTTGRFKASFPAVSPQALRNRTHKNIYDFFHVLLGTPRIFAHIDVWGLMRGTKNLKWPQEEDDEVGETKEKSNTGDGDENGEDANGKQAGSEKSKRDSKSTIAGEIYVDKPEWRQSLPPHWDQNPWSYVELIKKHTPFYQSVLALVDCDDQIGGFSVAPCSSRHLEQWTSVVPRIAQSNARSNHYDCPPSDPWYAKVQHVPIRKGEMVVWDSGSLHCNYPNSCSDFRLVQYVRCVAMDATPFPQIPADVAADLPSIYSPDSTCDPPTLAAAAAAAGLTTLQAQMLQVLPYPKK